MDMIQALRARLLDETDAGQKVTNLDRPQGTDLPAITLQRVAGERPQTHDGFDLSFTRVQLDAWAATPAQARAIVDDAVAVLAPRNTSNGIRFDRMFFEGERDTTERLGTQTIYRTGIDLLVWHTTA